MHLPIQFENWLRPPGMRPGLASAWPEVWSDELPEVLAKEFIPPVNVAETEKSVVITLEVPGMKEEDLDVEVMGNKLVISGEKKFEQEIEEKDFRLVESRFGEFSRVVRLPPDVRTDEVYAVCAKGVLTITVPKVEPTPTTKIKVRAN